MAFVTSAFTLPVLIFGLGQEKNVEYFINNQDEIAVTLNECEHYLEYAAKAKDENRFKEILDAPECKSAQKAKANISHQKWLEEQKEREDKAKKFEAQKQGFSSYLKSLDLPELNKEAYRLADECGYTFAGRFNLTKHTFECSAFSEHKKEIDRILITDIINKDSYFDISAYVASDKCSDSTFKPSYDCALKKDALNKSYEKAVNEYSKDRNLVSHTYNQCVDSYLRLKKEQGYKEARNVVKTDLCQVAKGAVKKLSLLKPTQMNFKTKIH